MPDTSVILDALASRRDKSPYLPQVRLRPGRGDDDIPESLWMRRERKKSLRPKRMLFQTPQKKRKTTRRAGEPRHNRRAIVRRDI